MKKIIAIILTMFFFACDVVEKPYIEQNGNCGKDNLSVPIKKILLEDYTGHKCGNCPQAHEKIQELQQKYCDHIIPVSIHVGYFATPSTGNYSTDFRTETGKIFNNYFGNDAAGLPNGLVNRKEYNNSLILTYNTWESAIAELLKSEPVIEVSVFNSFDSVSRELNCSISVDFLKQLDDNFKLNVWLTEDSIIDYQKDYEHEPVDIPNYVHRHVFRQAITSDWGDDLFSGTAEINKHIEKKYTFTLDTNYNFKYCHIVAFVSSQSTKEVYQADDEKIIK